MSVVAAYCRISEDPKDKRAGVDRQRIDLTALAERLDLPAPDFYVDNNISASKGLLRSSWEGLLAEVAAGRVQVVLTCWQDRFTRSPSEWERVLTVFAGAGARLITMTEGEVQVGTVGGRLTSRITTAVASHASEMTAERVVAASRHRAANGKANARPGYGYRRVRDIDAKGKILSWYDVIDKEEAAVIKRMASLVLDEKSLAEVIRQLEADGIPNPSGGDRWNPFAIRKILTSPRVAGLRDYHGEVVGSTEAGEILDERTWLDVGLVLGNPERRTVTDTRAKHLITGVTRCGVCGDKIAYKVAKEQYRCRSRAACVAQKKHLIDQWVGHVVSWGLSNPRALEILTAGDRDAADARLEIDRLENELAVARQEVLARRLSVTSLAALEAGFGEQIDAARARLLAAAGDWTVLDGFAGYADAHDRWQAMDVLLQRKILGMLVRITIHPAGRGSRTFKQETVQIRWLVPALDPLSGGPVSAERYAEVLAKVGRAG